MRPRLLFVCISLSVLLRAAAASSNSPRATDVEAPRPAMEIAAKENQYAVYFGYLHAHSALSDGSGTPLQAYEYARDIAGLDFFALTDHAELTLIPPGERNYETLKAAANLANIPGQFAALYGFEWSNPLLGHCNVINSEDVTDAVTTPTLEDFYTWLAQRPDAFGIFNHPGRFDHLSAEFHHLKLYPAAVDQMVGIDLWHGSSGFDSRFYQGSWNSDTNYYDLGLQNGWRIGALGAEDNHEPDWGTRSQFKMAVLAEELTREAIVDACHQRRFYSTEDGNLRLDFRCAGNPMGTTLSTEPREFHITASDDSGDSFQEVRLYRNGHQIAVQRVSGNVIETTFSDTTRQGNDYYYIVIRQTDDNDNNGRNDEAITSPIWFSPNTPGTFSCGASQLLPSDAGILITALVSLYLISPRGTLKKYKLSNREK